MADSNVRPDDGSTISSRMIAHGAGWRIEDVTCTAGPESRAYEERHAGVSIAAVVSGSFRYRSDAGTALLYSGAMLLGNPGACFECGHDHSRGDRCIAFHLETELFEEISATAAATSRFRFSSAVMPALPELLPTLVSIEELLGSARRLASGSLAIRLAERVTESMSGIRPRRQSRLSAGEEKRISAVVRHLELQSHVDIDLDMLASLACMSKYHFLRVFREVTGVTPYKYLLALRMRRAAVALQDSSVPISTVAFDAGFGDLSTFNRRFRETFGKTPSAFRQRGAG